MLRKISLLAVVAGTLAAQPGGNSYVDPKLCQGCHAAIAQTYAQTGMARSFSQLQPDFEKLPAPFYHQPSATWFAMEQRDGALYLRRWRIGYDGKEIDIQLSRVDSVMGSGNHARTLLHRTERGALLELPLAWYAENGGTWAMSPGHDRSYALPPRAIAYECMFCHNAYPHIPAGHEEAGSEPLYSGPLPQGIDCQRCHGPGGQHVRAAQQSPLNRDAVRRAIVNPARLSPDHQIEVCLQCHLETTSQPLPHSLVRFNRGPFSYKPGEPLGDFMLFFDRAAGPSKDNFEIVHSAYRLRQSACFLRSAGKLTCTTCHNPHDIPRGPQAALHYNAVCSQCHAALPGNHVSRADCVGCHMPKRKTQDVVHVTMTDHFIQRRPPPSDARTPIIESSDIEGNSYRGELAAYYPAPQSAPRENALYLALAQVSQKSNLARGLPALEAQMAAQRPQQAGFYVELGQALLSAGKQTQAIAALEKALAIKPASPVVALNLADALTQAGQTDRAAAISSQALRSAPADPLLWYQSGIAHSAAGHDEEAIADFRKSVALDPNLVEAHNLLGAALAGSGDLESAEKELRQALVVSPDYPDAQGNLGHLLAARGQLPEAAFYLARASLLKPGDAEIRMNYSVTLAGLNQFEEALKQIDAALRADPKSPEAHNFRGTLLEHGGNKPAALAEFLEAVRLQPSFDRAHFNAGRLLAERGDVAAALPHLRQAANSQDPNLQARAVALLRQIQTSR